MTDIKKNKIRSIHPVKKVSSDPNVLHPDFGRQSEHHDTDAALTYEKIVDCIVVRHRKNQSSEQEKDDGRPEEIMEEKFDRKDE